MASLTDLPASCRPRYDNSYEGMQFFRTRKDVCYHFWFVLEVRDFNIVKEGPKYAVILGNKIYATPWSGLHQFSVATIEKCVSQKYFYI